MTELLVEKGVAVSAQVGDSELLSRHWNICVIRRCVLCSFNPAKVRFIQQILTLPKEECLFIHDIYNSDNSVEIQLSKLV